MLSIAGTKDSLLNYKYYTAMLCENTVCISVNLFEVKQCSLSCHYTTIKAPNFDRVFMKNIVLLHNFARWALMKKIDQACKIKMFVVSKSKY